MMAVACGGDGKAVATPLGSPVVISATNQVPGTVSPNANATTSPGVVTGPEVEQTRAAQQASVAATAAARSTSTALQADVRAAAVSELRGADCTKPGGGLPSPNTPCVDFHMMTLRGQFGLGPSEVFYIPPSDLNTGGGDQSRLRGR